MGKKFKKLKRPRIIFDERLVRDADLVARHALQYLELIFGCGEVEIIRQNGNYA